MHLTHVSKSKLILGILLTGFLSLSLHAVMLQLLGIPYPSVAIDAPLAKFISSSVLGLLGLIYLAELSLPALATRSFAVRSGVIFVLGTALTESLFRGPFMEGYCSDSLAWAFISNLPKMLSAALLAVAVVAVTPRLPRFWQKVLAAAILGALSMYVLKPLIGALSKAPLEALSFMSHAEWCELPYGANVLVPAYLSFIEPVLAAVAAAALVWDRLSGRPLVRLLQFALLILLIKRQLLAAFIYMAYSGTPPLSGLASMGQFSLEALALALLAGLTWAWARHGSSGVPA
jgi:hypothetical protein